jgi:hypothetical protein
MCHKEGVGEPKDFTRYLSQQFLLNWFAFPHNAEFSFGIFSRMFRQICRVSFLSLDHQGQIGDRSFAFCRQLLSSGWVTVFGQFKFFAKELESRGLCVVEETLLQAAAAPASSSRK